MTQPFQQQLRRESPSYPGWPLLFQRLEAGPFTVSIQGSPKHASRPREELPADAYTHMEVAIFDQDNHFVGADHPGLSEIAWIHDMFEGRSTPSLPDMPAQLIQMILDHLRSLKP